MERTRNVRWFADLRSEDVAQVGGKNASLGELYSALTTEGVKVPNGFALTAAAYRDALDKAGAWERLKTLLKDLGGTDVQRLAANAAQAREIVHAATGTEALRRPLIEAYGVLEKQYGAGVAVAVRSSATAEDLPTASFAGQHESFLNVHGPDELFEACRRCFASVFTDRAIVYRNDNGFDHFKIGLSVGVMKMVRSDLAASGVDLHARHGIRLPRRRVRHRRRTASAKTSCRAASIRTSSTSTSRPSSAAIAPCCDARWDASSSDWSTPRARATSAPPTSTTPVADRERFCIDDGDVLKLADYAIRIEEHYSRRAGHPVPMDIEWAKDGLRRRALHRPGAAGDRGFPAACAGIRDLCAEGQRPGPVVTGRAVGEKIASGPVRIIGEHPATSRPSRPATCWWRRPPARTGSR